MQNLDALTSLEIKLGSAVTTNQMPVIVSYQDFIAYGSSKQTSITNNTTAVTICSAPNQNGNPVTRVVKSISVRNKDTAANFVLIQENYNSTISEIYKVLLSPDNTLFYESGRGWYILDQFGSSVTPITLEDMTYYQLSGTDTYTCTIPGLISNLQLLNKGIGLIVSNPNTGPSSVNFGFGAITLKKFKNVDTEAGDTRTDQRIPVVYDGTYLQIVSPLDNIG